MGAACGQCVEGLVSLLSPQEPFIACDDLNGIATVLCGGDAVLLKGQWILEHFKAVQERSLLAWISGSSSCLPLPRRQDLPKSAIWDPGVLIPRLARPYRRIKIVALSYSWLTQDHPDPLGQHLDLLVRAIKQWMAYFTVEFSWELAFFIDWCSLYQEPRTLEEDESFNRALRSVHVWYMNPWTDVWCLSRIPGYFSGLRQTSYRKRGWPTFERAVSGMTVKSFGGNGSSGIVLDLGTFSDETESWEVTERLCAVERNVLITPQTFDAIVDSAEFGKETDRGLLSGMYAKIFKEVTLSIRDLFYQELQWSDKQAHFLAQALPHCRSLHTLMLSSNVIGDAGFASLSKAFSECSSLRVLMLDSNCMGPQGAASLAQVLPKCHVLSQLNLDHNKIGDEGIFALAETLPGCPELSHLSLRDCGVSELGMQRLAQCTPKCDRLETLDVGGQGSLFDSGLVLAGVIQRCQRLRHLAVDASGVTPEGVKQLAEAIPMCASLETLCLSNNVRIGDSGADSLVEAIAQCGPLNRLTLEGCELDGEHERRILEAWMLAEKQVWGLQLDNAAPTAILRRVSGDSMNCSLGLTPRMRKVSFIDDDPL